MKGQERHVARVLAKWGIGGLALRLSQRPSDITIDSYSVRNAHSKGILLVYFLCQSLHFADTASGNMQGPICRLIYHRRDAKYARLLSVKCLSSSPILQIQINKTFLLFYRKLATSLPTYAFLVAIIRFCYGLPRCC